jgi:hypothetical protein
MAVATLALRPEGLAKLRRVAKIQTDKEFADCIRIDPGQLSRVLTNKSAPGPRFIAGCIEFFGGDCFEDLFAVIPDGTETAA